MLPTLAFRIGVFSFRASKFGVLQYQRVSADPDVKFTCLPLQSALVLECVLSLMVLIPYYRDVDKLIESLESTIEFFSGIEGGEGSTDDFVPFI